MKANERIEENEGVDQSLEKIEQEYNVTVLSARDFGSTAWNLDSEKSDRDVAFVYVNPLENYAQLGKIRENIDRDFKFNGKEHTFMGWNLKKFMKLLDDSNPTSIEFLKSPIIYRERNDLLACMEDSSNAFVQLEQHAEENFKPISLFYHYRSMAKSNFQKYIRNENDLTKKRHLYVMRGIMYARYVEQTHKFPSLNFPKFLGTQVQKVETLSHEKIKTAQKLASDKKAGKGSEEYSDQKLKKWMAQELEGKLDDDSHNVRGIDRELINTVIQNIFESNDI